MTAAALHDTFKFFELGKSLVAHIIPGACKVTVTMNSNLDEMGVPGEGQTASKLEESTGDIEVVATIWEAEQWEAYQRILKRLRMADKEGLAVFTSAHPEVRGRGIKKFYFISEKSEGYSPKTGYKVTLNFKEKLKAPQKVGGGDTTTAVDGVLGVNGGSGAPASAAGQAVAQSMMRTLTEPPAPADGGRANTAQPGYCSASVRVAAVRAGMKPSLFGRSAKATEANFRAAGLARPWNADSARDVREGDLVFWGNDSSGAGHIGVVVGRDTDGMPMVAGNNLVTYRQKGGRFDSRGQPIDRNIDSRGRVRLDQLSTPKSQPTSIGRPGGFAARTVPAFQGPAAPPPSNMPSQNVRGPRK